MLSCAPRAVSPRAGSWPNYPDVVLATCSLQMCLPPTKDLVYSSRHLRTKPLLQGVAMRKSGKIGLALLLSGTILATGIADIIINRIRGFDPSYLTRPSYAVSEAYAAEPLEQANDTLNKLLGREYTKVIKDAEGNPVLKVEVKYVGKSPDPSFPVNLSAKVWGCKPDFYNVIIKNQTNDDIEIIEITKWSEKGELTSKRVYDKEMLKKASVDILKENSEIDIKNRFLCDSTNKTNKFHSLYKVRYRNQIITFDIPLVYIK